MNDRDGTGKAIRAARTGAGLTVRALAARLGVSAATVSAIENGRTGVGIDRIRAIAAALDTTVTHLIGETTATDRPAPPAADTGPTPSAWREFPPLDIDPVLAAAIDAFVETGYHGATVRTLARRAGMSVPGVYHHYRDKQSLLVRALDLTMTELHWRVRAARDEAETPTAKVAAVVEALALFHTHRRELAFIGASEMRSIAEPDRSRITQSRNEIQYLLDECIDSAATEGAVTTPHRRDAGRAIATMCTSLPQWFRPDGPSTPEQIAAEYAGFALGLLGIRPEWPIQ